MEIGSANMSQEWEEVRRGSQRVEVRDPGGCEQQECQRPDVMQGRLWGGERCSAESEGWGWTRMAGTRVSVWDPWAPLALVRPAASLLLLI